MDPLSVGSAVIGVVAAGLHATHLLVKDIERIKDAPKLLSLARQDVMSVENILQPLSAVLRGESTSSPALRKLIQEIHIETAVTALEKRCLGFHAQMTKWKRHSKENSLSWRDKIHIGLLGEDTIQEFRHQIAICKATLDTALSSANLYVSPRAPRIITREINKPSCTASCCIEIKRSKIMGQMMYETNKTALNSSEPTLIDKSAEYSPI